MIVQIAVLCDAATDYAGKLNILGTFDTIMSAHLPAAHPQCAIALRIVFTRMEEGAHQVRVGFVDDDGRPVMPALEMPIEVTLPPEATFLARNFVINMQHVKFERAGQYGVDIAVDGRHETSIPLQVVATPPAGAPSDN